MIVCNFCRRNIEAKEGSASFFFLTSNGGQFHKVSQGIETIWRHAGFSGHFTLNLQRKLIDSSAARKLDKAEMRRLNAHMTHTEAVSLKTYQGRSNQDAVQDQLIIEGLLGWGKQTTEHSETKEKDDVRIQTQLGIAIAIFSIIAMILAYKLNIFSY